MMTAVTGANWGDEGKGRMVDLLSCDQDIVVRYQGGNNAGHTVVNARGKFILNLLPCGVLREGVVNMMGPGMVIDLAHLNGEIASLQKAGITLSPETLKISGKAHICLPYHVLQDKCEEARLGAKRGYGSTQRGIAPVYGDKYLKKGLRMEDLLDAGYLKRRLEEVLEWKSKYMAGAYDITPPDFDATLVWLTEQGRALLPFITDTGAALWEASAF